MQVLTVTMEDQAKTEAVPAMSLTIKKINSKGHMFGTQWKNNEEDYVIFLARLNNFYNENCNKKEYMFSFSDTTKLIAVHCKTKNIDDFLWYRGRILSAFKSTGGTLGNVLLVDEGETAFVPLEKSARKLDKDLRDFPLQQVELILFGLKPLNYVVSSTELVRRDISEVWDTAGIKILKDSVKGKEVIVNPHYVDKKGCFHVTMVVMDSLGHSVNLNEKLIKEGFAVFEDSDNNSEGKVICPAGKLVSRDGAEAANGLVSESSPFTQQYFTPELKHKCEKLEQTRIKLYREDLMRNNLQKEEDKEVNKEVYYEKLPSSGSDEEVKKWPYSETTEDVPSSPKTEAFKESLARSDGQKGIIKRQSRISSGTDSSSPEKEKHHRRVRFGKSVINEPKAPVISDDDFELYKAKLKEKKRKLKESSQSSDEAPGQTELLDSAGLLSWLTKQAKTMGSEITKEEDKKWPELDDVLFMGQGLSPSTTIESLHIPMSMLLVLGKDRFKTPTPLQAHTWPCILRGKDVVGIGPKSSGKTVGSLIPIFTRVVETEISYSDVPISAGPLVLVLTSNWRKVEYLTSFCKSWLYPFRKKVKVHGLYGGQGDLKDQVVSILNGCDILIATPSIINKMITCCYTDLERLCHLVFDDADVLTEDFTDDIKLIMRSYAADLRETKRMTGTRQLVANACEWTRGLQSLVKAYFQVPFVACDNAMEASLMASVANAVEICYADEKLSYLADFLDKNARNCNVVIFVEATGTAEMLCKSLDGLGHPTLLATEFQSPLEIKDVTLSWHASRSAGIADYVLVATDRTDLDIRNATCIVHYDFPRSKSTLSKRLKTMLKNMKKKVVEDSKMTLSSFFLITHEHFDKTPGLVEFFRRSGLSVPEVLTTVAEDASKTKEMGRKQEELCEGLKLFGKCRNMRQCRSRHLLFEDVDHQSVLPKSGAVKVLILEVLSASHFMARITEHRPLGLKPSEKSSSSVSFLQLGIDMQMWYSDKSHCVRPKTIEPNQIYAVKTGNGYIRTRVLYATDRDSLSGMPRQFKVLDIDSAAEHLIMIEQLLVLPDLLCSIPGQAIEVVVGSVKPVDNSAEWTDKACFVMDRLLSRKTLEGRIALSLGSTLWLDPLVEKTELKNISAVSVTLNVATELISRKFGERNVEHMKTLREMAKLIFPALEEQEDSIEEEVEVEDYMDFAMFPAAEYHDLYVSSVIHPGLFYVQLVDNLDRLDRLEDKVHAVMSVLAKSAEEYTEGSCILKKFNPGSLCVAKFSEDDRWYRGQILSRVSENEYEVFFFDHGDQEVVAGPNLTAAWPEILQLPKQAIQCCLSNIHSVGDEWSNESADVLWDQTKGKLLQAKVVSQYEGALSGRHCYEIELYDATQEHTVNINHEIVFSGHARGSDQLIQDMFPEAAIYTQGVSCQDDFVKIPLMCLQLYKSEDFERQLEIANGIKVIVNNSESVFDQIRESGGLNSMCQVFALLNEPRLQGILMVTIVQACQNNESNKNELRKNRGLANICNILSKSEDEELLEHASCALRNVATSDSNKAAVSTFGGLISLCRILERTTNRKLQKSVLLCLEVLCQENDQNCIILRKVGGLKTVSSLLENQSSQSCIEDCLRVLKCLVVNTRNRDELRECGCVNSICKIIGSTSSEQVLRYGLMTMKYLASKNNINADIMKNLGLVESLNRLLNSPRRSYILIKKLCREVLQLLQSVMTPFRGQEDILVPLVENESKRNTLEDFENSEKPGSHPLTRWSQQKVTITLAIKLLEIHQSRTLLSENSILFRAVTKDGLHVLSYTLYAPIETKDHTERVSGAEVIITLTKKEKGIWPRLLATKEKVPYLSIDFDRWVDEFSSTDDEYESEGNGLNAQDMDRKMADFLKHDPPSDYLSDSSEFSSDDEDILSSDYRLGMAGDNLTENFLS